MHNLCLIALGVAFAATVSGCGVGSLGTPGAASLVESTLFQGQVARSSAIELFVEPGDGLQPILGAINGAKKTLSVEIYMLTSPEVISSVIAAKDRGVGVRVLLEHDPFNPADPAHPLPTNFAAAKTFKAAGVPFKWTSKRFVYTHEKALVADSATAVIMTANLTKSAFIKNREYGVIDRIPADAAAVQAIFDADWEDKPASFGGSNLVVSPDNSRSKLTDFISSAKKSIIIQDEVMGDPALFKLLGQKARAGLDVRVEMARFSEGGTNKTEHDQLQAVGVSNIRFLSAPILHAKQVIIDGRRAYLGSINLTTNSLDKNRELGVIVDDAAVVKELSDTAEADWKLGKPL